MATATALPLAFAFALALALAFALAFAFAFALATATASAALDGWQEPVVDGWGRQGLPSPLVRTVVRRAVVAKGVAVVNVEAARGWGRTVVVGKRANPSRVG
ncbi:hypothetical protein CPC08DRAFT_771187 [Agrocybe pediades]|nr:hypothetical protein CPC08DRAFT_771187 [Agrocybe pediades]